MTPKRKLCASHIHVYWANLDAPCWTADSAMIPDVLSPDELVRAAAFRFDEDARRFMLSHFLMRRLLANYTGEPPSAIQFQYSLHGKPYLARHCRDLHFNLSHSGGVAVFALALMPVGVDTEQGSEQSALDVVANMYISDTESRSLGTFPSLQRNSAYLQIWTRKEALLKGIGIGLVDDLRSVPAGWPASPVIVCASDTAPSDQWAIRDIGPFHGAVGALAYPHRGPLQVTCSEFTLRGEGQATQLPSRAPDAPCWP